MATFVYTGTDERDFHDFGRLNPGDTVEADGNPSEAFFAAALLVVAPPKKPSKTDADPSGSQE